MLRKVSLILTIFFLGVSLVNVSAEVPDEGEYSILNGSKPPEGFSFIEDQIYELDVMNSLLVVGDQEIGEPSVIYVLKGNGVNRVDFANLEEGSLVKALVKISEDGKEVVSRSLLVKESPELYGDDSKDSALEEQRDAVGRDNIILKDGIYSN